VCVRAVQVEEGLAHPQRTVSVRAIGKNKAMRLRVLALGQRMRLEATGEADTISAKKDCSFKARLSVARARACGRPNRSRARRWCLPQSCCPSSPPRPGAPAALLSRPEGPACSNPVPPFCLESISKVLRLARAVRARRLKSASHLGSRAAS
jgi:hypothetical protein